MTTFARVVESGSLSAAARGLGISVAAVSRQMRTLERGLGTELTLRSTRHLTVTEAGRRYYAHCLRVLTEVEEASQAVRAENSVVGGLSVTAPVTLGLARVVPYLGAFVAAHPQLRVDLRLEDRFVDLVAEGVDVAIRAGGGVPDSSAVVARPLFDFHRVLVASPSYLARAGTPRNVAALAEHDALVHASPSHASGRWTLLRGEREHGVEVRGTLRTNNVLAIRAAASAGLGIGLLAEWLVEDELRRGTLIRVLPRYRSSAVRVSALFRAESRGSARVRAFVEHVTRTSPTRSSVSS